MCKEQIFLLLAGSIVTLGVVLGYQVSPWWLLLSLGIGLSMVQAGFTRICPMTRVLGALGVKSCAERSPMA